MRRWLPLLFLCAGSCAAEVAVAPGHGAVALTQDGQRVTLGEGVSTVPSLLAVDDFDLRQEDQGVTFSALTADGVPVAVRDSVVTFHLDAAQLGAIDRRLGAGYRDTVVGPVVQSAVGAVLATYAYADLDTPHLRQAEARIFARAATALAPYDIVLDAVNVKGVVAGLPLLRASVTDTGVWQERAAQAETEVDVARQRAAAQHAVAVGIAAANRVLAPTLNPTALANAANRAWTRLLTAPSTTTQLNASATPTEVVP